MSRRVYAGLTLLLLLAGGLLLWWVVSGPQTAPPARQSIAGLSDTVSIGWTEAHTAVVDAPRTTNTLAALGYVHGMTRPWSVTIWRRTALGTLSKTFGEGLLPLDRHARRLGFAHHARRTYQQLPDATQRALRAYTRGLNAALRSPRVQQRASFVALPLAPQRWRPWHALAIERLWAWVSTDPQPFAASELAPLRAADRQLRRWLHLHGHTRSVAWATRAPDDSTRTALFARHVFGNTADPVLQEVVFRRPEGSTVAVASVPGAPLFPTGTTGRKAWAYLLDSPARTLRAPVDSSQLRTRHERIATASGDEHLTNITQSEAGLVLSSAAPDSAWVLRWPGLQPQTDVPDWLRLAVLNTNSSTAADTASFGLLSGTGLSVDAAGTWSVHGSPPVVERSAKTVVVGGSRWARYQADGLRARQRTGAGTPAQWSASDSSAWAGSLLPRMVPDLTPLSGRNPVLDDALSYLRNWDHAYDPASIGAVLFEQWMQVYRTEIGRLPVASDSAFFAGPRRRRTFQRAVDTLVHRYGPDVRRWRWERRAAARRYFPVWSADTLVSVDLSPFSTTRFAPLSRPGRGHASALSGGPALVDPLSLGPAPTTWEGWMWAGTSRLTVRRPRFNPSAFFARSLRSRRPSAPASVSQTPISQTTLLVPGPSDENR